MGLEGQFKLLAIPYNLLGYLSGAPNEDIVQNHLT